MTDSSVRLKVVKLLGPRPFSEWPEAKIVAFDGVQIITKRSAVVSDSDKFENPDVYGGTNSLLSAADYGEVGGIKNFNQTNAKILEIVSHNNLLLMDRLRETVEDCTRQLKEKDDQIRFVKLLNYINSDMLLFCLSDLDYGNGINRKCDLSIN